MNYAEKLGEALSAKNNITWLQTKGPSIYDVHTEGGRGSGSGGRMWTGEGVQPHVDVHTEN